MTAARRNFIPPNIGKNTYTILALQVEIFQQPLHHNAFDEPEADNLDQIALKQRDRKGYEDFYRIMIIM